MSRQALELVQEGDRVMVVSHRIVTGRNGELDGMKREDVGAIARQAISGQRIVIHVHGGLVSEKAGQTTADRLTAVYEGAGAYPVFMVWQSGLFEVVRHNLDEIVREDLFASLLRRVLQFTVGKVWQEPGQRAANVVPTPKLVDVEAELDKREAGEEPYAEETGLAGATEVSDVEQDQLVRVLQADPGLRDSIQEVVESRRPETTDAGSRGVIVRRRASVVSLIDPVSLDEIDPGPDAGERSVLGTLAAAKKAAAVLRRVVRRFRDHEDHGLYPTVVEELLREFYLANAGGAVWAAMKKETQDTFVASDAGGRLLLDELARALGDRPTRPDITLVGHSAGAIYLDNLLMEVARGEADGYRPWPDDVRFRVILLAPAATYPGFASALSTSRNFIKEFRMFTMSNEAECADQLLGLFYPRSLLYLVSGTLERDEQGASAVVPIIGMARYRDPEYDGRVALSDGRALLTNDRVVLSPSAEAAPSGRRTGALSHGAFDDDPLVLDSIASMLRAQP